MTAQAKEAALVGLVKLLARVAVEDYLARRARDEERIIEAQEPDKNKNARRDLRPVQY